MHEARITSRELLLTNNWIPSIIFFHLAQLTKKINYLLARANEKVLKSEYKINIEQGYAIYNCIISSDYYYLTGF